MRAKVSMLIAAALWVAAAGWGAGDWNPAAFAQADTLDFLTVGPEEGEHWNRVWLVVLDGQVYVRLGSRAEGRMKKNTTAPLVKVRIAGGQFDRVRAEAVPEMKARVDQAMAAKYWSDFLARQFDHPSTMRLTAQP